MELAIFAKKRTTKEGKGFYSYLSTLTKKTGEKLTVAVKFRDDCGSPEPKNCPMIIGVNKKDANLSSREFVREDTGEAGKSFTLWVSEWDYIRDYIDTSLDEFDA